MLRRDFLKTSLLWALPSIPGRKVKYFGWSPPTSPSRVNGFWTENPQLKGSGTNRTALLYKYAEQVMPVIPNFQGSYPTCTGQAAAKGVEFVQALQTLLSGQKFIGNISAEMLYAGTLKIIGGRSSGGVGVNEVIRFLTKYGALFRNKYKDWDFSKTNFKLCERIINNGAPDWLLEICKQHPIAYQRKTNSYDEARDAIANLCPVIIGSSTGFDGARRDKDGFATPSGTWYHAWLLIAINDRGPRKGGCLLNSFGVNWAKGPKKFGQPNGSIWVDKDILDKMLSQYGDSYAIYNIKGLKPIDYTWS